jgi:type IV secretory pathway TrbF-like protein
MSNAPMAVPPQPNDYDHAEEQFLEIYGSTSVMNTYLKVALLCLCAVCGGLTALTLKVFEASRHLKPLVIRINDVGRAQAASYDSLEYKPQEAEIKYFLIQFVQQHYGRMRATVQENFSRSLYFLDGRLADEIIEKNKKSKALETFLSAQSEEVDVRVNSVAIEDLRKPPYRATVDYEKVFFTPGTRQETRREKYVGNFVFTVKERVTNAMIPVNPLGFNITYFREDQAFQ